MLLFVSAMAAITGVSADVLLVVNKSGNTVTLVDPSTGKALADVATGEGPHEVAVSPDGRMALVSNYGSAAHPGNSLTLIDIEHAVPSATIQLGEWHRPHGLAWLPDGRHVVVTAEQERAVLIIDVSEGKVAGSIRTGASVSHMVVLSADGRRGYVSNIGDGSVSVLDLEAGRLLTTVVTGAGAEGLALTPDGRQLWVSNREAGTVTVLDARSLETLATIDVPCFPTRVVISPDGRIALVSRAESSSVDIFDAHEYRRLAEVSMRGGFDLRHGRWLGGGFGFSTVPIGVLIHPGGRYAYVSNSYGGFVAVLDLEEYKVTGRLLAGEEPDGLAWSACCSLRGE
jgi:YVTN family beta-propeller protein